MEHAVETGNVDASVNERGRPVNWAGSVEAPALPTRNGVKGSYDSLDIRDNNIVPGQGGRRKDIGSRRCPPPRHTGEGVHGVNCSIGIRKNYGLSRDDR